MTKKTKLVAVILLAAASFAVYSMKQAPDTPEKPTPTVQVTVKDQRELAALNYSGTQTIELNQNKPTFTKDELTLTNGPWERYGDLDHLNRATSAEALLNKKLMPTEKRGEIASVTPTGWHNKKINGQYLYNRSHLIGYQLTGQNANWKNLITGTRQLNSPEMLRFEMDIRYYLEKSPKNYVRYSVTPIFRDEELLARGVHMMAQSIDSEAVQFNVYIFNVQKGVTLNYADGTSTVSTTVNSSSSENPAKQYVDENGKGLIKGSNSGVYHLPGSKYYDNTTNPKAWFKTIEEAKKAGYRPAK
ncbi:DNA/RNA non-specific endonuclease [Enterococcus viikkiensis]|uniref:DNA/RNA non-specific endonuclease n=2 Tax=Enterococcus viikkiensis TaxID=930854 RepID=A0ABU3FM46_9ENTE|nr:DNA/RNA non-specific endonuclease [Enterococcus viikkiensis]MDT2827035.1 DNA/RNA non-specific endonuclease [Enterococcus viikkiensis]